MSPFCWHFILCHHLQLDYPLYFFQLETIFYWQLPKYPYSLLNDISSTRHSNAMKDISMDRAQKVLSGAMTSLFYHFNSMQRIEGTFHSVLIRKTFQQTHEKGCHKEYPIYYLCLHYVSTFGCFQLEITLYYLVTSLFLNIYPIFSGNSGKIRTFFMFWVYLRVKWPLPLIDPSTLHTYPTPFTKS